MIGRPLAVGGGGSDAGGVMIGGPLPGGGGGGPPPGGPPPGGGGGGGSVVNGSTATTWQEAHAGLFGPLGSTTLGRFGTTMSVPMNGRIELVGSVGFGGASMIVPVGNCGGGRFKPDGNVKLAKLRFAPAKLPAMLLGPTLRLADVEDGSITPTFMPTNPPTRLPVPLTETVGVWVFSDP